MNLLLRIGIALAVVVVAVGISAAGAETIVRCGDVSAFTAPTTSAPGGFALSTSGRSLPVVVPAGTPIGELSGYACVSIVAGAPSAGYAAIVSPGSPGYVAPTLPSTATRLTDTATSLVALATGLVLFSVLVVFASYRRLWPARREAPSSTYNPADRQRPGGVRTKPR